MIGTKQRLSNQRTASTRASASATPVAHAGVPSPPPPVRSPKGLLLPPPSRSFMVAQMARLAPRAPWRHAPGASRRLPCEIQRLRRGRRTPWRRCLRRGRCGARAAQCGGGGCLAFPPFIFPLNLFNFLTRAHPEGQGAGRAPQHAPWRGGRVWGCRWESIGGARRQVGLISEPASPCPPSRSLASRQREAHTRVAGSAEFGRRPIVLDLIERAMGTGTGNTKYKAREGRRGRGSR